MWSVRHALRSDFAVACSKCAATGSGCGRRRRAAGGIAARPSTRRPAHRSPAATGRSRASMRSAALAHPARRILPSLHRYPLHHDVAADEPWAVAEERRPASRFWPASARTANGTALRAAISDSAGSEIDQAASGNRATAYRVGCRSSGGRMPQRPRVGGQQLSCSSRLDRPQVITHPGVEDHQHFAHNGHDGDLGGLAALAQPQVEVAQGGLVAHRRER